MNRLIEAEKRNKEAIDWIKAFISSGATGCNLGGLQFLLELLGDDSSE